MLRTQEAESPAHQPTFPEDPAFKQLRMGDLEAFHATIAGREIVDLSGTDLRGVDFRHIDLTKLILRDAYLRDADFRGCDLRHLDLSGASLHGARIGGAYFPANLSASEIRMSLRHGTRMRVRDCDEPD